ncbi:MAG: H/ACA ribonucleoprotein complex subunit GAR1 [Methanobacteriota archaeon]
MRALGSVVRITSQGLLIARSDKALPNLGTVVLDSRNRPAGRVIDVIGPAAKPYLVVEPAREVKLQGLLGKELYLR